MHFSGVKFLSLVFPFTIYIFHGGSSSNRKMSVKGFMIQKQLEDLALEKQYFQLLQHWLCVLGKMVQKNPKKKFFVMSGFQEAQL